MTYAEVMRQTAIRYLRECLEQSGWNVAQAARLAGLNRTHFHGLLKHHGIARQPTVQTPRFIPNWPPTLESVSSANFNEYRT